MELLKKLERALDLLIVVLERQLDTKPGPLTYAFAPAPEPKPEPKTRAKKDKVAAAPAPVAPSDPLMQAEVAPIPAPVAAAPAAAAASVVMTEDQSLDRAKNLAKLIVEAYPEKEAGTNRPKGFRLAMELLSKHKVARTTDLIHSQRLQFIAEGDALLAAAAPVAA